MFDISLLKIALIGGVALVVLGPERLPKVARTAGLLFGRLQRYVNGVKADIAREMDSSELAKIKQEVTDAAKSFEKTVNQQANDINDEARTIQAAAQKTEAEAIANANTSAAQNLVADATAPIDGTAGHATGISPNPAPVLGLGASPDTIASIDMMALNPDANSNHADTNPHGQGLFDFGIEPSRLAPHAKRRRAEMLSASQTH